MIERSFGTAVPSLSQRARWQILHLYSLPRLLTQGNFTILAAAKIPTPGYPEEQEVDQLELQKNTFIITPAQQVSSGGTFSAQSCRFTLSQTAVEDLALQMAIVPMWNSGTQW